MEDDNLSGTQMMSFRLDPKLIKLAKNKLESKDKTRTIYNSLHHILTCPNFQDENLIVYSVEDVAQLFDCAPKTIYRWIENGILSAHKLGTYGIFPSDLVKFLKRFNDDIPVELMGLMSKMSKQSHEFITPQQAMEEFGIAKTTLYRWIKQGKIRHVRISEERIWIFKKSVRRKVLPERPTVKRIE